MVDLPIKMVIFHSYDSLPEGIFLKVPWRSWSWVLGIGWYGMGPEFPMGTTDFRNVWSSCFVFQQKWSHPDIHLDVALDWLVVWNIGIVIVNDEHIFHLLDQSSVEIAPEVDSVLANLPMSESFEKAEALLSTQAKQDKGEGEEGWPFLKTSFLSSIFQFFFDEKCDDSRKNSAEKLWQCQLSQWRDGPQPRGETMVWSLKNWRLRRCPTMWGPRSIAKLVQITPIITNFMVFITIVTRAYKLTCNWGAHIASEELSCSTPSHHPVVFFHDYELVLNLYWNLWWWLGSPHDLRNPSKFHWIAKHYKPH